MRKKFSLVSSLMLLALVIAVLASGAASSAAQPEPAAIRLQAATFAPGAGEKADIPPGLTISGYAQGQRGYYLVQFAGPVQSPWKEAATAAGAELLEYIPDYAFKARMNPAQPIWNR